MNRRSSGRREGAALVIAIVLLALIALGTSTTLRALHFTADGVRNQRVDDEAKYLAEAGLESAIAHLRAAPDQYRGEGPTALGAGSYRVTATPGEADGVYDLRATGRLADGVFVRAEHSLAARLRLGPGGEIVSYHQQEERR